MVGSRDLTSQVVLGAVVACWWILAAAFLFRRRPPQSVEARRDRSSLAGVALQGAGMGLAWAVRRPYGTPLAPMPAALEVALGAATVALAAWSAWLVLAAVRALGKHWALTARIVEGHELVTAGPFALVRHPIYTGLLGLLLATGLAWSAWPAIPAALLLYGIGTAIRVRSEERLLRAAFPEAFGAWARRVPAVLPRLRR
jgi:protein-S-isoprenylcysteine O-methyltransferase Ste14